MNLLMAVLASATIVLAILLAFVRIRERRAVRFALLAVALALQPPASLTMRLPAASLRRTGRVAALSCLVFAAFFSQVTCAAAMSQRRPKRGVRT